MRRPQPLVLFVLRNALGGIIAGWAFAIALIWGDVAGVGSLLAQMDSAGMSIAAIFAIFGVTFGSAALGIALMTLGRPRED
ncbi:MAG: hypothetical protein AAGE18_04235 [Pseudomonadota bacterium]